MRHWGEEREAPVPGRWIWILLAVLLLLGGNGPPPISVGAASLNSPSLDGRAEMLVVASVEADSDPPPSPTSCNLGLGTPTPAEFVSSAWPSLKRGTGDNRQKAHLPADSSPAGSRAAAPSAPARQRLEAPPGVSSDRQSPVPPSPDRNGVPLAVDGCIGLLGVAAQIAVLRGHARRVRESRQQHATLQELREKLGIPGSPPTDRPRLSQLLLLEYGLVIVAAWTIHTAARIWWPQ
jgi:hypothetical protein